MSLIARPMSLNYTIFSTDLSTLLSVAHQQLIQQQEVYSSGVLS